MHGHYFKQLGRHFLMLSYCMPIVSLHELYAMIGWYFQLQEFRGGAYMIVSITETACLHRMVSGHRVHADRYHQQKYINVRAFVLTNCALALGERFGKCCEGKMI